MVTKNPRSDFQQLLLCEHVFGKYQSRVADSGHVIIGSGGKDGALFLLVPVSRVRVPASRSCTGCYIGSVAKQLFGKGELIETARLMLEDGRLFAGRSCGAPGTVTGEVCFNTSMTGYTEILTDPSYHGQILCLTTAEVGVYGVSLEDMESGAIQVSGFVVRHLSRNPSNWRSSTDLHAWLGESGVVAVEGIDTRALTRHLRGLGAMRGVLTTDPDTATEELLRLARASAGVVGKDFTAAVSRKEPEGWNTSAGVDDWYDLTRSGVSRWPRRLHVALFDLGLKSNIARHLAARGVDVTIVPSDTPAAAVLDLAPDGVLLSNGPGDPSACGAIISEAEKLLGKVPIGGICLGHQILALACGAATEKLPFGHRGANHPVRVLDTGRVLITSQNHGFTVKADTLDQADLELTHVSLNDGTVEGFCHRNFPLVAVQFHPEASPGPHDSHAVFFDTFLATVDPAVGVIELVNAEAR